MLLITKANTKIAISFKLAADIYEKEASIANNNNDCNRVGRDNEEGSRDARMHQADWQYQCAHRPIEALSHCPPSLSHCPANPSGNPGRGCYRRYHTATIRPSPHLMTPPFTVLWVCLPTILVIGNVPLGGVPATQHRCSGISSRSSLYFESIQGYPYH